MNNFPYYHETFPGSTGNLNGPDISWYEKRFPYYRETAQLDFEASVRKLNDCPFKTEKNWCLKDLISQKRKHALLFAESLFKNLLQRKG
jgi:hypothetical protein